MGEKKGNPDLVKKLDDWLKIIDKPGKQLWSQHPPGQTEYLLPVWVSLTIGQGLPHEAASPINE